MKKIVSLLIIMVIFGFGLQLIKQSFSSVNSSSKEKLYVYNWGDYIDPQLISDFENEYGYDVIYETYDSNESMYLKVKSGSSPYDVIFPSEYMVDKMRKENLLIELDTRKIPNLKNIDPLFMGQDFDPNNTYSVPYFWGTVGICYNMQIYDELNLQYPTSYKDLWNPSLVNNVLLVDGAREVVGFSLNSLGYSLNSTNEQELMQAKQNLLNLSPNILGVVGDEIKTLMINNEAAAAVVWSGDAKIIESQNDNIDFITPLNGSNIYLDNIAIPVTANNIDGAHQFINFLLDQTVASINTTYVDYSSPITAVIEELEHKVDDTYYPDEQLIQSLEYYLNLDEKYLQIYNQIFLEFKINL